MKKLGKNIIDTILQKWPNAEIFTHSETVINNCEVIITCNSFWFITLYYSSSTVLKIICAIVKPDRKNVVGYNCFREYEISVHRNFGKHKILYYDSMDNTTIMNANWSVNELVDHIETEFNSFETMDNSPVS